MKVTFLVPYRSDNGGRRDELWAFTRDWLGKHHPDWPIVLGESPQGPFNRGAAINHAALADEWDIAIVHDADNICDPETLKRAVHQAHETAGVVFPFSDYIYMDEFSSNRLMRDNVFFVSPERRIGGFSGVIHEHTSGIQVFSREAWDKIGGYVELSGWGFEDNCTGILIKTFVGLIQHLEGGAYHLYHESATSPTDNKRLVAATNKLFMDRLTEMEGNPARIREFLSGHPIPGANICNTIWFSHPQELHRQHWYKAWQYLYDRPQIRFSWILENGIQKINNPFPHMAYDTLYMGDTGQTFEEAGLPYDRKRYRRYRVLDPGVVGGDRKVLMDFTSRMISEWAGVYDSDPSGELLTVNEIGYSHPHLISHPWVLTEQAEHPIVWFSR